MCPDEQQDLGIFLELTLCLNRQCMMDIGECPEIMLALRVDRADGYCPHSARLFAIFRINEYSSPFCGLFEKETIFIFSSFLFIREHMLFTRTGKYLTNKALAR
ncbi:MAG: hypothetical protein D3903_02695 [Candidatus Electrothrix sp. GM3_4]|nr:hypothetical protein [Candidatus Electrothrix sp. GM3_4]